MILAEYETLIRRIRLNEQIIQNLETTAQTFYRKMFVDNIDKEKFACGWKMGTIGEYAFVSINEIEKFNTVGEKVLDSIVLKHNEINRITVFVIGKDGAIKNK